MSRAEEVPQESVVEGAGPEPQRALRPVRSHVPGVHEELRPPARIKQVERERARLAHENAGLRSELAALEHFAAMAAHELLKPLVMVGALSAGVLDREPALDPVSRGELDLLMRVSARVRVQVDALLIDALSSERPLRREPVDLSAVVGASVEALASEIAARNAHVEVALLPVVRGHAEMLAGVFANLLSNALKYGPPTGGDVLISARRARSRWMFAVTSEGRPIPEADRERIFEPWQRGIGERRAQGAGLGLAIVRRIVERHGGDVGVQPIRAGNRFFFTLPA